MLDCVSGDERRSARLAGQGSDSELWRPAQLWRTEWDGKTETSGGVWRESFSRLIALIGSLCYMKGGHGEEGRRRKEKKETERKSKVGQSEHAECRLGLTAVAPSHPSVFISLPVCLSVTLLLSPRMSSSPFLNFHPHSGLATYTPNAFSHVQSSNSNKYSSYHTRLYLYLYLHINTQGGRKILKIYWTE